MIGFVGSKSLSEIARDVHQAPRAPLPSRGVTSRRVTSNVTLKGITPSSSLILAHAPDQNPLTGSSSLCRWVSAGCCQSLLGDGPSRRYLWIPCAGAWTHTPRCPPGAFARFFPGDSGFTSGGTRFAHRMPRQCNFSREPISRLQSFTHVQAPALAQPPGCTHRKIDPRSRAARPYTPRRTRFVTCPEQWHRYAPVFGQLVRLDFHQLDIQPCRLLLHRTALP